MQLRFHHASISARFVATIVSIFASQLAIAAPTVDEVVREVLEYERRFSGVEVRRFRGEDFIDDSNDPFTRTMRSIEGSVTYDGTIGGRFFAEIERETMPVGRDGIEFRTFRRSRSYDGKTGIEVLQRLRQSDADGPGRGARSQATILPHSPLQDALDFQSMSDGSAATLGMFVAFVPRADSRRGSLGACLAEMAAKGGGLTITDEHADGVTLIKVADAWGNAYWLQPDRGYAIRRAVAGPPPGSTAAFVTRLTVDELIEIAPQQWYAKRGSWEQSLPDGSVRRTEFTVSDAAKPTTMPASFAVAIPPGIVVDDTTTNTTKRSEGKPREASADLDSIASGDKDRMHDQAPASARGDVPAEHEHVHPVAWLIVLTALAGLLVVVWRMRRRRAGE